MPLYKIESTNSLKVSTTDNSTASGYDQGGTLRIFRNNSSFLPDRYGTKSLVTIDSSTDYNGIHSLTNGTKYSLATPRFLWIEHVGGDGEFSLRCVASGSSDPGDSNDSYIRLQKGDFFQSYFDGTSTVYVEQEASDTTATFKYYKIG